MIILKPHQEQALQAIHEKLRKGQATICAIATGGGKTEVGLQWLADSWANGATGMLWICHHQELVEEPAKRVRESWSGALPTPTLVMGKDNQFSPFVTASIQTLYRPNRLDDLLNNMPLSHVVYDEAHHAVAKENLRVIRAIRERYPQVKIVGLTATPKRADQTGMQYAFDSVAFKYPINQAIKDGVLVPFVGLGVALSNTSFAGLKQERTADDEREYQVGDQTAVMRASNAHELIFAAWLKHAGDRQTIIFAPTVDYAHFLAHYWQTQGELAIAVDGTTPKEERNRIVRDFREGNIQIVINCALWTEGFDAPNTSCIVIARTVGSDSLYLQMMGRGLRPAPWAGKHDCLILDCIPKDARDIRLAGDVLSGKPPEQRKLEERASSAGIVMSAFGINSQGQGIDGDPDKIVVSVLNYMQKTTLAWVYQGDVASVAIGTTDSGIPLALTIVFPQNGRLAKARQLAEQVGCSIPTEAENIYLRLETTYNLYVLRGGDLHFVGAESSWESASELAEEYVSQQGNDMLSNRDKGWRSQPKTDKQIAMLARLGIRQDKIKTKGEAAQAITHAKVLGALRQRKIIPRGDNSNG
jgi:superfamily II DNA or RNA helicase